MNKPAKNIQQETVEAKDKAKQLPIPKGYKILIALPDIEETTKGGIIKASETRRVEEVGSIVGFVLSMGDDCYKDKNRFPNGPYCKEVEVIGFDDNGVEYSAIGIEDCDEIVEIDEDTIECELD